MGFGTQWIGVNKYLITSPSTFFSEYDETHGIGYPLAFMLTSCLAIMVPLGLLGVIVNIAAPSEAALWFGIVLVFGILFWITGLVEALLAHGIAYFFGARGVSRTLEAYAFPTVVRYGLWWIPLLNIALNLYGLSLQIRGLAAFHDISTVKAAIAGILATIFYLVPVFVVLAAVIGAFVLDLGNAPESGIQQTAIVLETII